MSAATGPAPAYAVGADGLAGLTEPHAGAWLGLLQAHRQLTRELDAALLHSHGLSLSMLELLARLTAAERRRLRLSALAGQAGLSLSRTSRLVDALERRGLAQRQSCPEDARGTNVTITEAGMQLARDAQASHLADVQRRFLDRLHPGEVQTLAEAFLRVTRRG